MQDSRNQRQHDVNRAVGFLTLGLILMGLVQATITALVGKNAPLVEINGILGLGLVVAVGLGIPLYQTGLLSS